MNDIASGLIVSNTGAWRWLERYQGSQESQSSRNALRASLDHELSQSGLILSIFGFELPSLGSLTSPVDCSVLLEPGQHFFDQKPESRIDILFYELYRRGFITSLWLEFDYPYTSTPLIYFSLSDELCGRLGDSDFKEFLDILFSPVTGLLPKSWDAYNFPESSDILNWLKMLPPCSIQQFGVSFRDQMVQPRVLVSLNEEPRLLFDMTNIADVLVSSPVDNQYLFAFLWPFMPDQIFASEIIADLCANHGLRTLRQPPRLRGSRLHHSIKGLLAIEDLNHESRNDFLDALRSLEHRISPVQSVRDVSIESIEISGWNHLKLIFKAQTFIASKLYGGTVKNQFSHNYF